MAYTSGILPVLYGNRQDQPAPAASFDPFQSRMQQFAETRLSNRCTGGKGHEDDNGKGLGGNQRQVMAIITSQLCDVTEKIRPFGLEGQAVKAIPEKAVVDEFVSATAGDLPNKKREARVRALNGIIARRLIARQDLPQGAMVWLLKE